jgi:hypothetical protein
MENTSYTTLASVQRLLAIAIKTKEESTRQAIAQEASLVASIALDATSDPDAIVVRTALRFVQLSTSKVTLLELSSVLADFLDDAESDDATLIACVEDLTDVRPMQVA